MEQKELLTLDPVGRAHAEVGDLARPARRIPTLHDPIEWRRIGDVEPLEPLSFDNATAGRCGHLEILSGKKTRAKGLGDLFQHFERFAFRMEGVTDRPTMMTEAMRGAD